MHIGESTLQYASEENNGCALISVICDETRLSAFCFGLSTRNDWSFIITF
jgi:hypothetical protein